MDGAGVLAADAVVIEEEARLDTQALRVFDSLERLADGRDGPDVRPDDGREALLLERLGESAGLDDVAVAEDVGAVGRAKMATYASNVPEASPSPRSLYSAGQRATP